MSYDNSNKPTYFPQHSHEHLKPQGLSSYYQNSRAALKKKLESWMDEEITSLGLPRNGYRVRKVHTVCGTLDLAIPRVRGLNYWPSFLIRGTSFDITLLFTIQSLALEGMSQRSIAKNLENLFNTDRISQKQIHTAFKRVLEPAQKFLSRDLSDVYYPVLYVDAHYVPIREDGKVSKKAVMVAIGRSVKGKREVLGLSFQTSEASTNYTDFFQSLLKRGLQTPETIVSDEHKGLRKAIRTNFAGARWRRCSFHLIKTATQLADYDRDFSNKLSKALLQNNHMSIIHDTFSVLEEYHSHYEESVKKVQEALIDLINFENCDPLSYLTVTNNESESLNSTFRLRSNSIRVFTNSDSYLRYIGNLIISRNSFFEEDIELEEELQELYIARKDESRRTLKEKLKSTHRILAEKVRKPCIIWLDEFFTDVSIGDTHVSLGVLFAFGCQREDGFREPLACEYILGDKTEAAQKLMTQLKAHFDLSDVFLIVTPFSLEQLRPSFKRLFKNASWQLDTESFIEAVTNIVPKKKRQAFEEDLQDLYKSKSTDEFKNKSEKFIEKYAQKYSRAISLFKSHYMRTYTYLTLPLPEGRIKKVEGITRTVYSKIKTEIKEKTVFYLPYLYAAEFDKIVLKSCKDSLKDWKKKAYIASAKLKAIKN